MSNETETYVVTEGTDTLEGKPVRKGQKVQMTPAQALYHEGMGRLERMVTVRKPASVGKSTDRSVGEVNTSNKVAD